MAIGRVFKSTGSRYIVRTEDGQVFDCTIRGKIRTQGLRLTNPIAAGDVVSIDIDSRSITDIHERRNYIIRKSVNLSKEAHIIASNVDLAMLVVTVNHPVTPIEFIDRFLITSEAYNIPAAIVFNKNDIYSDDDICLAGGLKMIYEKIGYTCISTSSVTGEGCDELKELMKGKTTVVSGMSGVGKSSLINAIQPQLELRTSIISSAHDSGKHTTTFAEMFELDFGGFIIDTPGVRSFGIIDMEKSEISHYFPEIFKKSKECKFYNCTHIHEPGCAVLQAVEDGDIAETRYNSYLSLMSESKNDKYR